MAESYGRRQILGWQDMTIFYSTSYNDRHKYEEHFQFCGVYLGAHCTITRFLCRNIRLSKNIFESNPNTHGNVDRIRVPPGRRSHTFYLFAYPGRCESPRSISAVKGSVEKVRDGSQRRWKVRKPRKDGAGGGKRKKSKKNIYISRRQTI